MSKNLFVSLPMSGIEDYKIKHRIQKLYEWVVKNDPEYKLINAFVEEVGDHKPVWYLGRSIQLLEDADAVIFACDWNEARGCVVEHKICTLYGIPILNGPFDI